MRLAGTQHACQKFFPRQRLARAGAVQLHMLVTKAASPHKRLVVMQTEVVLHPKDGGLQLRIARVQPGDVFLPFAAQRADAQLRFISLHIHHGAKVLLRPQRFAKVRVHDAVPLVNRHRNTFFSQQRADFAHHCKIHVLLAKAHMAGVDLLHVGEYSHVVDIRLVHIAQQRRDLLGIVEAGVAAEAENILKWIFFHRAAALLSVKCGRAARGKKSQPCSTGTP